MVKIQHVYNKQFQSITSFNFLMYKQSTYEFYYELRMVHMLEKDPSIKRARLREFGVILVLTVKIDNSDGPFFLKIGPL